MLKRFISVWIAVSVLLAAAPLQLIFAEQTDSSTLEISNQYIKVIVNKENGGYVISTLDGDILKKSDDNAMLTHRGEYFDTSFTSFKIGSDEYIFGSRYGIFGTKSTDVITETGADGESIISKWSVGDISAEQKISLVNNDASEQLGTAMITYTVKNNSSNTKSVKSRILIDTQLGENDYGYYEVPKQNLGQGYEYFEFEKTWDSTDESGIKMPSDYFVRDNPYSANIVGYGVNSVFAEQKPYKMTFAHWANIASTVFDYTPDEALNFTNNLNNKKTADSAAALYYDLGSISAGQEKTFSTYYGVTANLKNKDNDIIINTTAPSKLKFKDAFKGAYEGSDGTDNVVRINVNLTNPQFNAKKYNQLAVVVYTLGFETQRQTDGGNWIKYNNADPVYSDIIDFKSGENRVTYFDFKFEPKERAQLGTFVIKVFNMDEEVNELGYYAEDYCLGSTENHIILPGRDSSLPAITLTGLAPDIIYNNDIRYITVSGRGMEFFRSDLLNKIELRGENGISYEIQTDNIIFEQGSSPKSISIMLEDYMEPGRYRLHFVWKNGTSEPALDGVPEDFTSDAMVVQVSSDIRYYNAYYGVVTVQRAKNNKYEIIPYKDENEFQNAGINEEDLLLSFRGDIQQDKANKRYYRLTGKDKDVNINYILNYHGDDMTLEKKDDGTVEILMDGKITTVGANTTVRNGTAAFRLNGGTEYIIPEYSENGEVEKNGELVNNQDFIELKWDNAFDTLTTVGGFLIDMKYGVLGKIQNDDNTKSDIISFGGSLDLGFMTPGGAAAVRQNTAAGARWTTKGTELQYDDNYDGYTFGLTFDEDSGEFKSQIAEKDIEPSNKDAERVEIGAAIHDVLYGGKNPGYIGINMSAHAALPQIVKFLPNKIEGDLSINTIGGYNVGVDAEVEMATLAMSLSLVVKASPSGAPVPDKLFFAIGGFEPGFNVDGLGVVWVTGGGGGFDNLYDTIYGKDGIPPLTLLMRVEFDITKILTGTADLELSLRSLKISFDDLSLKMLKDAKFIDGGEIAVGWYPNFNLNLSAGVNFMQIMNGRFTITAAAGNDTADFVQFVLNVSLGLPKYIPIVGGMELASAELGGGSEKVWGSVVALSLIKVGFTYYWGGSIEFTHGNPGGGQNFAALSAFDDAGVKRTKQLYNNMLEPIEVGTDSVAGEKQFASVGGNLMYSAGSTVVSDLSSRISKENNSAVRLMDAANAKTEIFTDSERTNHLISFGEYCDYILSVSRADGSEISADELKNSMKIKKGNAVYDLRYYSAPGHDASDDMKKEALESANINVTDKAAYIAIPKSDTAGSMLIEFSDNIPYDVSAIKVNPISAITSCNAELDGNELTVKWDGENISDTAKVVISAFDSDEENKIILNESEIPANAKNVTVTIPDKISSGEYSIRLTLSDEGKCFDSYDAGKVMIANNKAPGAIEDVTIENCGDNKLKINVAANETDFDGYLVEVFEDGRLADTGLYFGKDEELIIGGRYDMPVPDESGKPTGETVTVGYTPDKEYSVKVRLCNVEDTGGGKVYYSGAYKASPNIKLKEATPPSVKLDYNKDEGTIKIKSDTPVSGELYINSRTNDGEWYKFSDRAAEFSQKIVLEDGEYTFEFLAEDADGDHVSVKEIISIDTTAPVILLAAPQSGECFDGEAVTVAATADKDADYTFKINDNTVIPREADIFADGMLRCTIPLGAAQSLGKVKLDIIARDSDGNETIKSVVLTNKKVSEITSISIDCGDKIITDGKLSLSEGESAELKIFGNTANGERLDITDMSGTLLEVTDGTSARIDGTKITAGFSGQALVHAALDLGGNESLDDGIVVEVSDTALIFDSLDEALREAKQIENTGYTDDSWNNLLDAIKGAEQIKSTPGITQRDIDNAATAISNAVAGLKTKDSGSGGLRGTGGIGIPYYTVSFNTNGGSTVESQKVKSGNKLTVPKNPSRNGYTFDGWYSDKQLINVYDFNTEVSKSFTLYAKWIENVPVGWNNPFDDVSESDWFFKNVEYVTANGWFNGISDNEFAPNNSLTRTMLVTVLWRAEGSPETDAPLPFTDAGQNEYYSEALRWAADKEIVKGMTETTFEPDNSITREQIAAIIFRYARYKGDKPDGAWAIHLDYGDAAEISDWASEAVMYCKLKGVMTGDDMNMFNPKNNTTRAEAAAVLQRFYTAVK